MRDIDAGALAALSAGDVLVTTFVLLDLEAGTLRLNSSGHSIAWDGETWTGVGDLGSIEEVTDGAGERKAIRLTISGMSTAVLSSVLGSSVRDRDCKIWMGILNTTTHALLDVVPVWFGKLSQATVTRSNDSRVVSVTALHIGDYFDRAKPFRNTDADQRAEYAGDTSRRFVVSQSQRADVWPAAAYFKR